MNNGKPRRIIAYVRVSRVMGREGDSYQSPAVQEETIRRWAEHARAEVVAVITDEDVSGGTKAIDRPGLSRAFEILESGEADGLAVSKLNRFSRSTLSALRDLERLEEIGAAFVSVEEDFDSANPFGRFALTMLLAVATLERDNIVAGWKVAKARALARGAKIGPTPFGYRRREDGTLEPHPERAEIVRQAFRLARQGIPAVVAYLDGLDLRHENGKRTDRPLAWTAYTVRRLLANRSYIGELRYGGQVFEDAHEALVTQAEWRLAQHEAPETRSPAADFPLSGLATCSGCGGPMVGGRGGKGLRTYRCANSLAHAKRRGRNCPAPATMVADRLEQHVDGLIREAWTAPHGALVLPGRTDSPDVEALLAAAEEAQAETAAFVQFTSARTPGYAEGLADRQAAEEDAWAAYREAEEAASAHERVVSGYARMDSLEPEEWAQLVRDVVAVIEVRRGRGPVEERVRIIPHDRWSEEAPILDTVGALVGDLPPLSEADAPELHQEA
jgi:site-specific DNA recombinase